MFRLFIVFLLAALTTTSAFATIQVGDTIRIEGRTYGTYQLPMNGYWRYEDEAVDHRQPVPDFEATNSANWRGYRAKFAIANGRLYLDSIKGRIAGKRVKNEQIIDKIFPVRAHWYTGSIFVSVGGYDELKEKDRYVIEFQIEKGIVIATHYSDARRVPTTWNGVESQPQAPADAEQP